MPVALNAFIKVTCLWFAEKIQEIKLLAEISKDSSWQFTKGAATHRIIVIAALFRVAM